MMVMRTAPRIMIFKGTRDSLNDGHENCPKDDHLETRQMMVMRTAPRIMVFKGTRDSLNDGQENCPEDDHLETH